MIPLFVLLSCGGEDTGSASGAEASLEEQLEPLSAPRLLRRASLDLRGVLPSESDLDRVEADPSEFLALATAYMDDVRFEDRMVSLQAERWHTVMDLYEVWYSDYGLPDEQEDAFAHSVGEEPLRLIAHVLANDLPWTDVVTADYTLSDELLASIWPIDYPEGGTGWLVSSYTDGRPAAGVLSTNGMWWRYVTNISNKNRGRVAAISSLLLCVDILGRPVVFTRGGGTDPEDAIRTDPACQTCHSAVDPVAGNLFGFWWTIQYNTWEMSSYHPEREKLAQEMLSVEPGWYGAPSSGLGDLGWFIANDPRFARCAVEGNAELLWRRDSTLADFDTIENLRAPFAEDGMKTRALLSAILETPQYQAGAFTDRATTETRGRERVERLMSNNQLRTSVEDLTGFQWTYESFTQLENDVLGYRTLVGGVDGYSVGKVQQDPGLTWFLVAKRLAQASAQQAVARDLGEGSHLLLQQVTADTQSSDPEFEGELESLHWRLFAERADDAWLESMTMLFDEVLALSSTSDAWEAVIEVMLRDPRFVSY